MLYWKMLLNKEDELLSSGNFLCKCSEKHTQKDVSFLSPGLKKHWDKKKKTLKFKINYNIN